MITKRLALLLLLPAILPAQDRAWWDTLPVPQQSAGDWSRESFHLTVRDGVRLAVDLYLPESAGEANKVATMLHQTRYRRAVQFRDPAREAAAGPSFGLMTFLNAGYAVVVVDVRGTGASFGSRKVEFSPEEVMDGWDVLEWIVAQPWSDGSVGATGISYPGTTAELVGTLGHPALKAVAPLFSIYDFYPDVIRPGGIFLGPFFQFWAGLVARMDNNTFDPAGGPVTGVRPVDGPDGARLLAEAIVEHSGNASIYPQAEAMVTRDDRFADGVSLDAISPHALYDTLSHRIPIYNYGGWADGFSGSQIKRFLAQPSLGSRLIMGPWNHGGGWAYYPHRRPVRSQYAQNRDLLRFFDYHVRGISTGIENEPPVWYFTTGSDEWRSATSWPVATGARTLHLLENHQLGSELPTASSDNNSSMTIEFDSTVQLGTGNQSRWNTIGGGGAVRYEALPRGSNGNGWAAFDTPPLESDLTMTGAAILHLLGLTNSAHTTVFAYIEDVDPSGVGSMVTEGQLHVAHRRLSESPAWYPARRAFHSFARDAADWSVPREQVTMAIELLPTSHTFKAGHRVRVVLRSADRDHFVPAIEPFTFTIQLGNEGSRLVLPVE